MVDIFPLDALLEGKVGFVNPIVPPSCPSRLGFELSKDCTDLGNHL